MFYILYISNIVTTLKYIYKLKIYTSEYFILSIKSIHLFFNHAKHLIRYWVNPSGMLDGVKEKCLMSNTLLDIEPFLQLVFDVFFEVKEMFDAINHQAADELAYCKLCLLGALMLA